jgi:hypothetical protein
VGCETFGKYIWLGLIFFGMNKTESKKKNYNHCFMNQNIIVAVQWRIMTCSVVLVIKGDKFYYADHQIEKFVMFDR